MFVMFGRSRLIVMSLQYTENAIFGDTTPLLLILSIIALDKLLLLMAITQLNNQNP